MLHIRTLATPAIILVMASVTLSAQSLMVGDEEGARVTAQIGHGGNGLDVAAALDSPAVGHLIRFRADVGHGAWDGINSRGGEPPVTRATGSALLFFRPPDQPPIRGYVGIGIGAYLPHRGSMHTQFGPRLTLGFEGEGYPWTIGSLSPFADVSDEFRLLCRQPSGSRMRVGCHRQSRRLPGGEPARQLTHLIETRTLQDTGRN